MGLPGHLPQGDEVIPHHLPGEAVVLHEAQLIAVHHGIILLMFQQHPHHRGLGHDGVDAVRHPPVLRQLQQVLMETGAVIGPDVQHPLLHMFRREHAGIDRQIAAFGMATQPHLPSGILLCNALGVFQRFFLGRDLRHTGHLKVLFPPRQSVIRSPEGEIQRPIPGLNGQRRELLPLPHIQMVHEAVQPHVSKALRGRHFPQHLRNRRRHQNAHVNGFSRRKAGEKGLRRQAQGHALPLAGGGDDPLEIHKGKLRQNQIIHFIQRGLGQGQIPSPVQIIQQVRHVRYSFPCLFVLFPSV